MDPFSVALFLKCWLFWDRLDGILIHPFLYDHCRFNRLTTDDVVLLPVLWVAWLQFVARQVSSRETMAGLHGLDPHLLDYISQNLNSQP